MALISLVQIVLRCLALGRTDKVNKGSDNGLVPSGNNPLPEPVLNQFQAAIWRH